MGLQRLMSMQRNQQRRRRKILARNESVASANKQKGFPCQSDDDGDLQAGETTRCSIPDLPEDIWHHIHSLMPMRDAARAACLSHAFLCSWRCYPNLTFNQYVFSPKVFMYGRDISHRIDSILGNHSGIGVKILKLELFGTAYRNLDNWLQVAVTPGIEELTLRVCRLEIRYNFPCALLSDGVRNSIRYLELGFCIFRPTAELGPLGSLTKLHLQHVRITGDELECLLSNSLALEQLVLIQCKEIICLRIPCVLQRFSCLRVLHCVRLKLIESKVPNLSTLDLSGKAELSLGETLQIKNLSMHHPNAVCYARSELPSSMPHLDTLALSSNDEVVNTPMLPTKFLYLKHLTICLSSGTFSPSYDYFSLVSFLDASPSLETLNLDVTNDLRKHESILGHSSQSHLRQMAEDHHWHLKNVEITGFSSAKSLVELTCYILKNSVSLECLTLDTLYPYGSRCSDERSERCSYMRNSILREARRALVAIRRYIEDKHKSILGYSSQSHLRQMAEDHHFYLKSMEITGFSSSKSLVELSRYILRNSVSWYNLIHNSIMREAFTMIMAIKIYIEDRVLTRVKLDVVEPRGPHEPK
uniref:At1g61320/AtMIF1 LRR domain-containing protein n=1 Tax=Oryza punctata TaxID=4537 RepID=A0A0E0JPD2_ORYPU